VLEGSDHNLFFDNPSGIVKIIKDDLRNINEFESKVSNKSDIVNPKDVQLIVEENENRDIES
jgi:hypothetical protein